MIRVRWGFIIALAVVSLVALVACDQTTSDKWEADRKHKAEMLAPLPPTDIPVWCKSVDPVTMQAYPYRDLAKQGCYIPNGEFVRNDERGKLHCVTPSQRVTVVCEEPELSEGEAAERWERFNRAVDSYRRATGQQHKGEPITWSLPKTPPVEAVAPNPHAPDEEGKHWLFTVADDAQPTQVQIARSPERPTYLTINGNGKELARLNMDTGDVKLSGDPNEAAKIFWQAVSKSEPCKGKVTDHANSN